MEIVGHAIVLDTISEGVDAVSAALVSNVYPEATSEIPGWQERSLACAKQDWISYLAAEVQAERISGSAFQSAIERLRHLFGIAPYTCDGTGYSYSDLVWNSPTAQSRFNVADAYQCFSGALDFIVRPTSSADQLTSARTRQLGLQIAARSIAFEFLVTLLGGVYAWAYLQDRDSLSRLPSRFELLQELSCEGTGTIPKFARAFRCEQWWVHAWAMAEPNALFGSIHGVPAVVHLRTCLPDWPNIDSDALAALETWGKQSSVAFQAARARRVLRDSKLFVRSRTQGIPTVLHKKIVHALAHRQRAMTNAQLTTAVGRRIQIRPLELPPGPILAYGRHPKFYTINGAHFVLKDWVQSEHRRKGRIVVDRLITPLVEKRCEFDDAVFQCCLSSDLLYKHLAVVRSTTLALAIARQLPDLPIDLHHLWRIRSDIEKRLKGHAVGCRNAYFVFDVMRDADNDGASEDPIAHAQLVVSRRLHKITDSRVVSELRELMADSPVLRQCDRL